METVQSQYEGQSEGQSEGKRQRKGISGSTIKFIALFAMLVDHTSAIIIERMIFANLPENMASMTQEMYIEAVSSAPGLYIADMIMRLGIGRIGFPLFCFLLVEGFLHTSNAKKYLMRMAAFALISEVPFDLAFRSKLLEYSYQNVFFTLTIGLSVMYLMKVIREHFENKKSQEPSLQFRMDSPSAEMKYNNRKPLQYLLHFIILLAGMGLAALLRTDYGAFGVLTIVVMYYFRDYARNRKVLSTAAGCIVLVSMTYNELTALFALIPVALYNGKKGVSTKYLFYIFYPAHILILYLIAVLMGLGNVTMPY